MEYIDIPLQTKERTFLTWWSFPSVVKNASLCLLVRENTLCLGIKKKKLGKGKYNGFGGMQEAGETVEQTAIRELEEEARVHAEEYHKVAEMTYRFPSQPDWDQIVHVYIVTRWKGEPTETDEMTIEWFSFDSIPYHNMWDNDKYRLPQVLAGNKLKGTVVHDGNTTIDKQIHIVSSF